MMIDAHAFLYFGDGQSVKFHSGRYKPDGGALMIGKEGIEGWWSAPDVKTSLTERATGNGAHDVNDEDVTYAARTVTVHFAAIGDDRAQVLASVRLLSSACGSLVRLRVVDADSDTYVTGYVQPSLDAVWREDSCTGTLTIVCPRPERLAWSPLQTQLFPVSVMQGGLKYSTVHKLVSAWTGTANASASTLSKNGSVVATNYSENPEVRSGGPVTNAIISSTDIGLKIAPIISGNDAASNMSVSQLKQITVQQMAQKTVR